MVTILHNVNSLRDQVHNKSVVHTAHLSGVLAPRILFSITGRYIARFFPARNNRPRERFFLFAVYRRHIHRPLSGMSFRLPPFAQPPLIHPSKTIFFLFFRLPSPQADFCVLLRQLIRKACFCSAILRSGYILKK